MSPEKKIPSFLGSQAAREVGHVNLRSWNREMSTWTAKKKKGTYRDSSAILKRLMELKHMIFWSIKFSKRIKNENELIDVITVSDLADQV